jgi:hypothetical protein
LIAQPTPFASGTCAPTIPYPPRSARSVVEVHRAAEALRAPRRLAEELGHHRARRDALGERLAVRAVGGDPVVVHRGAGRADRDRLLADVEMAEPEDLPLGVGLGRLLLETPDHGHCFVETEQSDGVELGKAAVFGQLWHALSEAGAL